MKERPILFSSSMVRALLEGRKTQTRRVVKPQPIWVADPHVPFSTSDADPNGIIRCPYGHPGDRLWVRETFQVESYGADLKGRVHYRADDGFKVFTPAAGSKQLEQAERLWDEPEVYKPSIHMPRWASRIDLEITGVRVERLQDISREDALAEGCTGGYGPGYDCAQHDFMCLWQSINGPENWDANPWVWVVEFKRLAALKEAA